MRNTSREQFANQHIEKAIDLYKQMPSPKLRMIAIAGVLQKLSDLARGTAEQVAESQRRAA